MRMTLKLFILDIRATDCCVKFDSANTWRIDYKKKTLLFLRTSRVLYEKTWFFFPFNPLNIMVLFAFLRFAFYLGAGFFRLLFVHITLSKRIVPDSVWRSVRACGSATTAPRTASNWPPRTRLRPGTAARPTWRSCRAVRPPVPRCPSPGCARTYATAKNN